MTDTKRIRELLEDYRLALTPRTTLRVAKDIIAELPALLDKADKYDKFAASVESYLAEQAND